jgi:uncharacterized repeat protein (TIGR01451 family)
MKNAKMRILGSLCLGWGLVGFAHAVEPVTNALTVHRVVVDANGREKLESAATAKPGDLLEYVVEFHNNGQSTVHGLAATLPLPAGTEFVAGSQAPVQPSASLDGSRFEPLPLKRKVTRPDGAVTEELVPAREYRFLRWNPADLAANGTLTVSARVMVEPAVQGK